MELDKRWVTPAIVGVISFVTGIGAGYAIKRYTDSKTSGSEPRIENGKFESKNREFDTESSNVDSEGRELGTRVGVVESELVQMQFMFEERDRKYDTTLQQAMKVVAALQDAKREFANGVVEALKHNSDEHVFAVEAEGEQWSEDDDQWDYDEEVESRSPKHPYIIHRDEYMSNEMDLVQSTLTYYKGDNILCDDLDVPIYQPEKVVGPLRFGHGSQDPSIVYIRNEELEGEYEVLLDYGTFEAEILNQKVSKDLGVQDLKHSLMKFKEE
jgi:hypothetical protein